MIKGLLQRSSSGIVVNSFIVGTSTARRCMLGDLAIYLFIAPRTFPLAAHAKRSNWRVDDSQKQRSQPDSSGLKTFCGDLLSYRVIAWFGQILCFQFHTVGF